MKFLIYFSFLAFPAIFGSHAHLHNFVPFVSYEDYKKPVETFGPPTRPNLLEFSNAAVTCDAPLCGQISKNILVKGGTVGDAAIAGLLCMGVIHPHTSGFGGGLSAVYYNQQSKISTVISAREQAPLVANESMFDNLPIDLRSNGGLAIALPAEIKGLEEIYERIGGNLEWAELFEPSIQLLEEGIIVDKPLASALRSSEKLIKNDAGLNSTFINPNTQKVWVEGDSIKFPVLAETFKIVAQNGSKAFYDPQSPLALKILQDLSSNGALFTPDDFSFFSVQVQESVQAVIGNHTLYTAGAPSSGASLVFLMRILEEYKSMLKPNDLVTSQLFLEATKHAYGRWGNLGDPDDSIYENLIAQNIYNYAHSEEYLEKVLTKIKLDWTSNSVEYYQDEPTRISASVAGTAHLTIVGQNGEAVSVTTTLGNYFGAKVGSIQTGIIFNNKMSNFEVDPINRVNSPNKIGPGKRPLNTVCPSIYTDESGMIRLAIGGAGGMRIISSVAAASLNHLWLGMNVEEAISTGRIHNSLYPMVVEYEAGLNETLLSTLQSYGHELKELASAASVVGISRDVDGHLWATWDPRKPGSADGF